MNPSVPKNVNVFFCARGLSGEELTNDSVSDSVRSLIKYTVCHGNVSWVLFTLGIRLTLRGFRSALYCIL